MRATLRHVVTIPPTPSPPGGGGGGGGRSIAVPSSPRGFGPSSSSSHASVDGAGIGIGSAAGGKGSSLLASPTASALGPAPSGTSLHVHGSSRTVTGAGGGAGGSGGPGSTATLHSGSTGAGGSGSAGGIGSANAVGSAASALGATSAAAAAASSSSVGSSTISGLGSVAGGGAAGGGADGGRPRLLAVHPTLPLCVYVLTDPSGASLPASSAGGASGGVGGTNDDGDGGGSGTGVQSIAGLMRGSPPSAVASSIFKPRVPPGFPTVSGAAAASATDGSDDSSPSKSTAIWDGRDQRIVVQDYVRDSVIKVWNVSDVAGWINSEECRRDVLAELADDVAAAAAASESNTTSRDDADGSNKTKKKNKTKGQDATNHGLGNTIMLGTIRSVQFWDRHVGHFTCAEGLCDATFGASSVAADAKKFHLPRRFDASTGTGSGTAASTDDGNNDDGNKSPSTSGGGDPYDSWLQSGRYQVGTRVNSTLSACGMMPPSIIVQFDTRAVLLNMRGPGRNPAPGLAGSAPYVSLSSMIDPYRPLTALITPDDLAGNVPTSPAVPITSSILAVGCSDGTVRFYDADNYSSSSNGASGSRKTAARGKASAEVADLALGSVIKSVRGPNGRSDPVVRVVNANADSARNSGGNPGDDKAARILTVCASGVAFLWEMYVALAPDGTLIRFKINPPTCRLDGLGENRRAEINPSPDFYGGRAQCSLVTATRVTYDAQNDVVSWCVPNYAGVGRYHTATWELKRMPQATSGTVAPRLPPRAVVVLPTSLKVPGEDEEGGGGGGGGGVDGAGGAADGSPMAREGGESAAVGPTAAHAGGSSSSIVDVVPGYAHPSLPCDGSAVACLVVTQRGDVVTVASSIAGGKDGSSVISAAIPFHRTTLSGLLLSSQGSSSGGISPKNVALMDPRGTVRVYAVAVPMSHPTVCLMATPGGVAVLDLVDCAAQIPATRHALLAPDTIGSSGQRGQVAGRQRNPAALTVIQGVVYAGILDCPPINSATLSSGPVRMLNLTPVYTNTSSSQLRMMSTPQGPSGSPKRPRNALKPRPRLLPSPSGNYVCLYWHRENRYEILHLATLIKTSRASKDIRQMSAERQTSAMVDAGSNILSFAWVGDEDVFSLLHPPAAGDDGSKGDGLISPQGTVGKKGSKKVRSKLKAKLSSGVAGDDDEDNDEFDANAARLGPRVELKILVGVTAEATEISGSVAAATSTTLGDIVLRGGARHPPTALFGGPVLCVASLTYDREGRPEGMAYLYTRKEGTEAADNRASAYGTAGPSLPYPDHFVWDDEGRHCAAVVGDRVAVYRVSHSSFSLIGTAPILSGLRAEHSSTAVESVKFIHGVLYVSTQNLVQVIFLSGGDTAASNGEIDGDGVQDGWGTLDSYVLAGPDVPASSSSQDLTKLLRPSPLPIALNQPSILAYHGSSLLLSTASGVRMVPLLHPLLRIGILLAAGQPEVASKWFDAVPRRNHEALAIFLERRGAPDMAVNLQGLSLESTIDICIRYGMTDRLKDIVDTHSVIQLRAIDGGGRGGIASRSLLVGIALNLFANGHVDAVSRIASDLLDLGDQGRAEGRLLAGLLVSAGAAGSDKLLTQAVGTLPDGTVPAPGDIPATSILGV